MDCRTCKNRLAGKSLFSCLDLAQTGELEKHRSERKFKRGQVLFDQDDGPFGIYCLATGLVKLEAYSPDGHAQLLRLAGPGEPLGYRAFLSGSTQNYRAIALTNVLVCFLPAFYLSRMCREVSDFSLGLIEKLSRDLQLAEARWLGLMQKNSEQRVAELLLEFHRAGEGWPPRKDMAHLVDITPETFARILARFESLGWLSRTRKKLELLQFDELEKLSQHNIPTT